MGGGASVPEEDWDDVPINKADLHHDAQVGHRLSTQALADQMSFTSDFGRLSPQSKLAADPFAVNEAERLQQQAASHWHRIMTHTREQRQLAAENGEPTPCPVCGQMTDDPQFCGFCGDIEEATQQQITYEYSTKVTNSIHRSENRNKRSSK